MAVSVVLVLLLPSENGRLGWVSQNNIMLVFDWFSLFHVLVTTINNQSNVQTNLKGPVCRI